MKLTIVGFILIGIIAAVSATVLIGVLRADVNARAVAEEALDTEMEIIVAARDLPSMSLVDATAVARKTVPAAEAPVGALTNTVQAIGQILAVELLEGEPIRRGDLAAQIPGVHLAATLPEGGRAMSILLDADNGMENVIYPGCIVDVMASFRVPGQRGGVIGEIVSTTLLQGVRVLAVGNQSVVSANRGSGEAVSEIEGKKRRIVTLLLDPEQAERLQLAVNHGEIALALRNPLDNRESFGAGVVLSDLSDEIARRLAPPVPPEFSMTPMEAQSSQPVTAVTAERSGEAPPEEPEAPGWKIELLRGSSSQILTFPVKDEAQDASDEAGDSDDLAAQKSAAEPIDVD